MATSAELAGQIAEYDKNKVTSTDALNSALTQYGVPEIRKTVSGLRTTLANTQNAYNAVDPSVTGRTQGSLVTEAQRQKQVNNERAPIAGQISDQGKSLTQNEQDLQDALGQATTQATNKVNDYNTGRAALQSEYNDTYGREQDAAKAAASAAAAQEQQREFNAQQATTRGSSSYGGGAAKPLTQTQTVAAIRQGLESVKGKDNHVAPNDLAKAYSDWLQSGFSSTSFWSNFQGYWNPKQADYSKAFYAAV